MNLNLIESQDKYHYASVLMEKKTIGLIYCLVVGQQNLNYWLRSG